MVISRRIRRIRRNVISYDKNFQGCAGSNRIKRGRWNNVTILAVREICRACTTFSSRMHAHAHARSPNREKDPYELFAVGELLGPSCEFPVVYIESNREDRPTSRWEKKKKKKKKKRKKKKRGVCYRYTRGNTGKEKEMRDRDKEKYNEEEQEQRHAWFIDIS